MLRLVLRACCLPMDAASCSASPRASCLLPAYGYSFVLRIVATPMDIALCSAPAVTPTSLPTRTAGCYA
jgi:hypothetical protein